MKRLGFLKRLLSLSASVAVAPMLIASRAVKENYKFDEIFSVWKGNDRLIYPKKDSIFYQQIEKSVKGNISNTFPTFLPVHQLSIPVKSEYSADELKPIQFYFECVYMRKSNFSTMNEVIFRMIKDSEDRMHLDVFLDYNYKK